MLQLLGQLGVVNGRLGLRCERQAEHEGQDDEQGAQQAPAEN
jgi:hypothetical protein